MCVFSVPPSINPVYGQQSHFRSISISISYLDAYNRLTKTAGANGNSTANAADKIIEKGKITMSIITSTILVDIYNVNNYSIRSWHLGFDAFISTAAPSLCESAQIFFRGPVIFRKEITSGDWRARLNDDDDAVAPITDAVVVVAGSIAFLRVNAVF